MYDALLSGFPSLAQPHDHAPEHAMTPLSNDDERKADIESEVMRENLRLQKENRKLHESPVVFKELRDQLENQNTIIADLESANLEKDQKISQLIFNLQKLKEEISRNKSQEYYHPSISHLHLPSTQSSSQHPSLATSIQASSLALHHLIPNNEQLRIAIARIELSNEWHKRKIVELEAKISMTQAHHEEERKAFKAMKAELNAFRNLRDKRLQDLKFGAGMENEIQFKIDQIKSQHEKIENSLSDLHTFIESALAIGSLRIHHSSINRSGSNFEDDAAAGQDDADMNRVVAIHEGRLVVFAGNFLSIEHIFDSREFKAGKADKKKGKGFKLSQGRDYTEFFFLESAPIKAKVEFWIEELVQAGFEFE